MGTTPEGRARLKVMPALTLWLVLLVVVIVLIAQNSADTTVQIFGWTVQAPLFMVIVAAMVIGWALVTLGTQAWSWRRRRGRRHDDRRDKPGKEAGVRE
jgi:uncharacterized integral membrane protein